MRSGSENVGVHLQRRRPWPAENLVPKAQVIVFPPAAVNEFIEQHPDGPATRIGSSLTADVAHALVRAVFALVRTQSWQRKTTLTAFT